MNETAASDPRPDTPRSLDEHRRRQRSVAEILDGFFGTLGRCKPQLWEQRAYLLVIGIIYERLAAGEREIATEDLAALARMLSDQRKARPPRPRRGRSGAARPPADGGELTADFARVVRQVYGAGAASGSTDGAAAAAKPRRAARPEAPANGETALPKDANAGSMRDD